MKIQRQLTVFLENQPGMMDRICAVTKEVGVNILAFTLFGTVDHGVLRMIVDRPLDALHGLSERGILVIDTEVIEIEAPNEPGSLEAVTAALSKAKVNIEYGYGSTAGVQGAESRLYLQVSDNRKALMALRNDRVKTEAAARRAADGKKPAGKRRTKKRTARPKKSASREGKKKAGGGRTRTR